MIREINRALGITSVVITHDVAEVPAFADYCCIISGGQVVAFGTPDELHRSDQAVVRQFMKGLPDGPVPFHFPAPPIADDLLADLDEVFADEDPELPDVARAIMDKLEFYWKGTAPGIYKAVGDVTGKEFSRRQQLTKSIAECLEEEMGVHWEPANKQDKEGSLEMARMRVRHGRFTIDPKKCADSVRMLLEHKFKEGTDMPSEVFDEPTDLLRYFSHEVQGEAAAEDKTPIELMLAKAARKEEARLGAGLNAGMGSWLGQRDVPFGVTPRATEPVTSRFFGRGN